MAGRGRAAVLAAGLCLIGAGSAVAAPTVEPSSLDLGTASPGKPGAPQTITLTAGPGEQFRQVTSSGVRIGGGVFEVVSNGCGGVVFPEAGGSCTVTLRMNVLSGGPGPVEGLFTFDMNPPGQASPGVELRVPLKGTVQAEKKKKKCKKGKGKRAKPKKCKGKKGGK